MTKSPRLGMRFLSLTLCVLLVLCPLLPAQAADTELPLTTLTTVVRNGAYYSASPIGQLEDGTALTVLEENRSFYKIDCYDMTGYVARSQVEIRENECYVNCDPESTETRIFTYTDHAEALQLRNAILELAKAQLGKPYIYGSTGMAGFDCSGLTSYLYSANGTKLHRRASEQLQDGIIVSREGMQVGDLVFFHEWWDECPASHVGIYAGNNRIIHASSSRGIVYADLDGSYFSDNFLCVRRIVDTNVVPRTLITGTVAATGRRAG